MTSATRTLGLADYLALALYFAVNLGIGWWYSHKKQSTDQFFRGGGQVVWWAAGISFFATATSSISFMALPAKSFTGDWLAFGSAICQVAAVVVIAVVFVGLLRRLNMTTVFEYLELRFGRSVRLVGAALVILLKVFGRVSIVLL